MDRGVREEERGVIGREGEREGEEAEREGEREGRRRRERGMDGVRDI